MFGSRAVSRGRWWILQTPHIHTFGWQCGQWLGCVFSLSSHNMCGWRVIMVTTSEQAAENSSPLSSHFPLLEHEGGIRCWLRSQRWQTFSHEKTTPCNAIARFAVMGVKTSPKKIPTGASFTTWHSQGPEPVKSKALHEGTYAYFEMYLNSSYPLIQDLTCF